MEIQLTDFRMEFEDQGLGLPVLLIHGYPFNHTLWEPQIKELQKTARLLAPDLRGFGGSDPMRGIYTMELLAQDCHDFLNNIGVKQPVVVGGLSMGGYVALAFYRMFPERVMALLLTATRAGADSAEAQAGRMKNVELALERGAPAIAGAMLPRLMSPKTYSRQPDLVAVVRDMIESASVEGIVGALLGMRDRPELDPNSRPDRYTHSGHPRGRRPDRPTQRGSGHAICHSELASGNPARGRPPARTSNSQSFLTKQWLILSILYNSAIFSEKSHD